MKKQILFVIMAMCATCAMAVSLPSASYSSYTKSVVPEQGYTVGTGTTFINQSTVGVYEGGCTYQAWDGDVGKCQQCCIDEFACGELDYECQIARGDCMDLCGDPLGGLPLDAPTAFLLALVAAYGAVAVYRTKVTKTM